MVKVKRCSGLPVLAFALVIAIAASGHAMDVTLGWNANTETNLNGYKVYYGTIQGGPYNGTGSSDGASPITVLLNRLSNPGSPEFNVRGLSEGKYYFVVTAFNAEGVESGYSNEVYTESSSGTSTTNSPPVLSSLEVDGQTGSTNVYTDDRNVAIRIVASDDTLVAGYLILDDQSDPAGKTFLPVPGGAKQNPIVTVNDFLLNDTDGARTIYAWVKDDQGFISAAASKTNVILERVPTVVDQPLPELDYSLPAVGSRSLNPNPDGGTGYEAHPYGTAENSLNFRRQPREAIEVLEVIPVDNLGTAPGEKGVQHNTGFSVRIDSVNGVDMTDPDSVAFTITDGERTYTRRLNDLNGSGVKLLRVVPWDEEGDRACGFWAVYYRSNETAIPNTYPSGSVIEVAVNAKDRVGEMIEPVTFRFRTQSDEERHIEAANLPETSTTIDPSTSMKRITITSGPLRGASILFSTTLMEEMGFEPYFGPEEDVPFLAGLKAAGTPLNLLPHTLFTSPVTLIIPCPANETANNMGIYYHDGRAWWMASDSEGNVIANGEGWMVPGSRINHEQDRQSPEFIEIQVYHFSAAAAASLPAGGNGNGGVCFISSLWR